MTVVDRSDLELPLAWHDLCVGSRDGKTGLHTSQGVFLDEIAAVDLQRSNTAVVRTLRSRETVRREASWPTGAGVDERVLLLETEDRLLIRVLPERSDCSGTSVRRMRRQVGGEKGLAENNDVVAAASGVRALEHRIEDNIRIVTRCLVGARTVESPDTRLFTIGQDLGLGTHFARRFGSIDPQIFGPVDHVSLLY